jgi:ABC-2 type transport system ATP-binding protein
MHTMIDIQNLNKTYAGGFEALKDVSLSIRKGEIFALLGPNGAGKTTLINIVCGIVNKTSGTVLVDGNDIVDEFRLTRAKIGLVPQELPAESFETVWNTCRFSRGLFGKGDNPQHVEKVLRSLSLWDKKDTIGMQLSGGMKRRVLIAKALSHEPEVLFLDEPTAGVDPISRRAFWELIYDLAEANTTILVTTHYMDEAEHCQDLAFIQRGKLVAKGPPEDIKLAQMRGEVIEINCDDAGQTVSILRKLNLFEEVALYGALVHVVTANGSAHIPLIEAVLTDHQIEVVSIDCIAPSLEDVFISSVREAEKGRT